MLRTPMRASALRRNLGGGRRRCPGAGHGDRGDKRVIGGLARAFFRRVKAHYDRPEAWRFQRPEECPGYRPEVDAMWVFEPHVAEAVFEDLLREHGIPVRCEARLDREHGVALEGTRITSITTLDAEAGNRAVAGDCSPSEPSGPPLPPSEEDRGPDGQRSSFSGPCAGVRSPVWSGPRCAPRERTRQSGTR